jgi:uncharacterized protein (DUF1015 family)
MEATATQLSPIFGLHPDDSGAATTVVHGVCDSRDPDMTADLGDGVLHEVWTIEDEATIEAYRGRWRARMSSSPTGTTGTTPR